MSEKKSKLDLDKVFVKVLELLVRHNPHELNYSKISRITGIPRPTLYYYFGVSKQAIIDEAIKYGIKRFVHFYNIDQHLKDHSTWHDFQKARLVEAFKMAYQNPWAASLYFRFRAFKNTWGDEIRSVEESYIEKLSHAWKSYHHKDVDPQKMRFVSYMKVGALWGAASDEFERWNPDPERKIGEKELTKINEMAEQLTRTVTLVLSS